jgi:uncharacterized protein YqjF (DUF2071 family)
MEPAYFVSPRKGFLGWLQNSLANMQLPKQVRRTISARLPFPTLESDVSNIVYANWNVPLAAVDHLIPPGVKVIDVDGKTILTILTYAHGHFGPSAAGPLRRLFPSPLQSNWRLYVQSVAGKKPAKPTVLFLANIFDSDLYAIGTRIFSDVMHAHRAMDFNHQRRGRSWITQVRAIFDQSGSYPHELK